MFCKITNQPSSITSYHIDYWIKLFIRYASANAGAGSVVDFTYGLELEFSDEVKSAPYKTMDDVISKISGEFDFPPHIRDILDDPKHLSKGDLLGTLAQFADTDSNFKPIFDELQNTNIVDIQSKFGSSIAGEYIHKSYRSKSKIVLYSKVIEKDVYPGKTLEDAYHEVFIHELFHAFNYYLSEHVSDEIARRKDYTSDVVLESLAAYFEYNYCKDNGIETNIDYDWKRNRPCEYPYSGADSITGWSCFSSILNMSCRDLDKALRTLLDPYYFYEVKNVRKVEILYRTVGVPSSVPTSAPTIPKKSSMPISHKPNLFRACQTNSFLSDSRGGYLFAPASNRYKSITEVKKGDIILHIFRGKFHAIGIAKDECYQGMGIYHTMQLGNYVDEDYEIFNKPIDVKKFNHLSGYPKAGEIYYLKKFDVSDFTEAIIDEALSLYPGSATLQYAKKVL